MPKEIVGVVGAGTMGAGIAQVALEAGHEVLLNDVDEAAIGRGRARVRDGLGRRAANLDLDADTIDAWIEGRAAGLRDAHSLDALGAEADVVIEAALEDLDLKQTIFRALDAAVGNREGVILATNTSALSVGSIAAATDRPARVVGLHFFNPAPLMALVEVVAHDLSDEAVVDRAVSLVESWGKVAVRSTDSPGFIVNRVNRPFTIEALRLVERGEASVEAIDSAIRDAGFPMGPFELMDLVGVDVNLAAARAVWEGLGRPDRLRPSPIQERLVDDERLGRKTGAGFYAYADGRRAGADPAFAGGAGGLTGASIVAMLTAAIDAEASRALADGVATEDDIDRALRLGAGHPVGPFERMRAGGRRGGAGAGSD
ncbi:MAG TPA: 3-hydroxyacyl-CoA dehydrogenase NAD-binding domain-containing protein [Candidatus Limnocylindrales bacterium]|nr:3-hydroxyacyl-CoA dehydrogenase NAD-binding domain-containing protein [Candidatus Limnocylindrales bacterium]